MSLLRRIESDPNAVITKCQPSPSSRSMQRRSPTSKHTNVFARLITDSQNRLDQKSSILQTQTHYHLDLVKPKSSPTRNYASLLSDFRTRTMPAQYKISGKNQLSPECKQWSSNNVGNSNSSERMIKLRSKDECRNSTNRGISPEQRGRRWDGEKRNVHSLSPSTNYQLGRKGNFSKEFLNKRKQSTDAEHSQLKAKHGWSKKCQLVRIDQNLNTLQPPWEVEEEGNFDDKQKRIQEDADDIYRNLIIQRKQYLKDIGQDTKITNVKIQLGYTPVSSRNTYYPHDTQSHQKPSLEPRSPQSTLSMYSTTQTFSPMVNSYTSLLTPKSKQFSSPDSNLQLQSQAQNQRTELFKKYDEKRQKSPVQIYNDYYIVRQQREVQRLKEQEERRKSWASGGTRDRSAMKNIAVSRSKGNRRKDTAQKLVPNKQKYPKAMLNSPKSCIPRGKFSIQGSPPLKLPEMVSYAKHNENDFLLQGAQPLLSYKDMLEQVKPSESDTRHR